MILKHLANINDYRRAQGKRYELKFLLLFSLFTLLTGGKSYRDIHRFIKAKRKKLNQLFGLNWKNAPSKSMLSHTLSSLDVLSVEQSFRSYTLEIADNAQSCLTHSIDGKVLKKSFDNSNDVGMLHLLSVFCSDNKLIMGHENIDDKTNEIPAAQEIIKLLNLPKGSVFTLDAMHCQKKTFEIVNEIKGELIAQIKLNQKNLFNEVATACHIVKPSETYCAVPEKNRNRIEERTTEIFEVSTFLNKSHEWKKYINCVAKVTRKTQRFDTKSKLWKSSFDVSYYACSHRYTAKRAHRLIRGHWGIENTNHYVRDVSLKEDDSRIRKNPGVFARIRSFTLNIMRLNNVKNIRGEMYTNGLDFDKVLRYQGLVN